MAKQTFKTPLNFQQVDAGTLEDKVLVRSANGDVKEVPSSSFGGSGGGSQNFQDTLENGSEALIREDFSLMVEDESETTNNSALDLGLGYVELRGQIPEACGMIVIDQGKIYLLQNKTDGGAVKVEFENPIAENTILIPAKPAKFEEDGVTPMAYKIAVLDDVTLRNMFDRGVLNIDNGYQRLRVFNDEGEKTKYFSLETRDEITDEENNIEVNSTGLDFSENQASITSSFQKVTETGTVLEESMNVVILNKDTFSFERKKKDNKNTIVSFEEPETQNVYLVFPTKPVAGTYKIITDKLFKSAVEEENGAITTTIEAEKIEISEFFEAENYTLKASMSNKDGIDHRNESEDYLAVANVYSGSLGSFELNKTTNLIKASYLASGSISSTIGDDVIGYTFSEARVEAATDWGIWVSKSVLDEDEKPTGYTEKMFGINIDNGLFFRKRSEDNTNTILMVKSDNISQIEGGGVKTLLFPDNNNKTLAVSVDGTNADSTGNIVKVFENNTSSALSLATLNSAYPNAKSGDVINCLYISGGAIQYEKTLSGWIQKAVTVVS